MFFICLFIIFALAILYYYLTSNYDYWKKQGIPCAPDPVPGFGHALPVFLVKNNLAMWTEEMYRMAGKRSMFGCFFMRTPALVVRDPELIKTVLHSKFSSFQNNMITLNKDLDPILIHNPFFAKDESWRESRKMVSNNFSKKTVNCLFFILIQVCDQFTKYVEKRIQESEGCAELEVKSLFVKITGEMSANAAFGIEGHSFEDNPDPRSFISVAGRLFDVSFFSAVLQCLRFYYSNLADLLGVRLISKEMDKYFRDNIRAVIKRRLQNNERNSDILQIIMERMGEINEDMVVAQATSIFFDGYETSSTTLSFVIYRIAQHPEIQEKARQEVRSVLQKFDNQLSYEAVKSMTYLDQIMFEALRMNSALGEIVRYCTEDVTLEGPDTLKCNLKPGDMVLVSGTGVHMDEEFWPNPHVFDPERFDSVNKTERNKYTYLAFGEGPRACIGQRMGAMTVKTVAALILNNYSLEASPKTKLPLEMDPNTFAWVAKGGLWVYFKKLSDS